jgi:septin family protein
LTNGACNYVVASLKPLDIAFMRAIHHKVNIVPIIAKSDTVTKEELIRLKRAVSLFDT